MTLRHAAIAVLALVLSACQIHAADDAWSPFNNQARNVPTEYATVADWERAQRREARQYRRQHTQRYAERRKPQVRAWVIERAQADLDRGHRCRSRITLVGDQALSADAAKVQADKAIRQQIRFQHGERFTDLGNGEGKTYSCVRSSIGSIAGQDFDRCEVSIIPCSAPRIETDK